MSQKDPQYRHHKASGRAFVAIRGRRVYLGKHGTADSRAKYELELIKLRVARQPLFAAEIRSGNGDVAAAESGQLSLCELLLAYWRHAQSYYRPIRQPHETASPSAAAAANGTPREIGTRHFGKEALNMWYVIEELRKQHPFLAVSEFTPKVLKSIRQAMIDRGLGRDYINGKMNRIRRIFKWGVAEELVPSGVLAALQTVQGLKVGRSDARETEDVPAVAKHWVEAVLPYLSSPVRAMAELQLVTGLRSDNVTGMRACEIDTCGKGFDYEPRPSDPDYRQYVWIFKPAHHKTKHLGKQLLIALGPQAREIIRPFLGANLAAYLFNPALATEERNQKRRAARKTPLSCGNVPGSNRIRRKPKRAPGVRYSTRTYARAIARAIIVANRERRQRDPEAPLIPHWSPHQVRHRYATDVDRQFGLIASSVALGHSKANVTQLYVERNFALAQRVAREMG
jgi:integrase